MKIFLNKDGTRKKFFKAAIGGLSVGVPGTVEALFQFHNDFGKLKWDKIIKPVIDLAELGFYPPPRLLNALKRDKYLFSINRNFLYEEVIRNPRKKNN